MSGGSCEPVAVMDDGWSEWIHPLPGYLMQCCDCGLIHEMQVGIGWANGQVSDDETLPNKPNAVFVFRMRRHEQ